MTRPRVQLQHVKLEKLRPTQLTVGKMEVALKRKEWAKLSKKARIEAIANHCFPAVLGPEQKFYIVDHHHFGLALIEEEVSRVSLLLLKDLSSLQPADFWRAMDHHHWAHPYDEKGVRRDFTSIPTHLTRLRDDPYRSLAGELRRAGGYAKDAEPFSEFLWADFFRPRISVSALKQNFAKQLRVALKLAHGEAAHYLPGWAGKNADG
jgi:hypothetical protein